MRKSKGQTIDLLYTNKKEINKKSKTVGATSSRPPKKKKTNSTKKKTKKVQNNNNIINLDNEMIIDYKKENDKKQKTTNAKKTNNKKAKSKKKKQNPKKKRKMRLIKWVFIIILLITAIILFMMSSVFNIKEIIVVNNSKVSSDEIIKLSSLTAGVNMFKITNGTIREGIKINAYIEDVKIKRSINGVVTLDIKERQTTYMLKFVSEYAYINNQGYILEITEEPMELPIITGFSTPNEVIKAGNRLNNDDLNKLDDINKIIESSKYSPLANIITEIDILDSPNYKLTIASEEKTVKIGDMTNINIKLQIVGQVFTAEKGKIGEIYFQDDGKKAVFKEEVLR